MIDLWWERIANWIESDNASKRWLVKAYGLVVALCVINLIIKLLMKGW